MKSCMNRSSTTRDIRFFYLWRFQGQPQRKLNKMNTNTQNTIPLMKSFDFNLCNKGISPCTFNFAIMQNIAMERCADCNYM